MRHVVRGRGMRLAWFWRWAVNSCPGCAGETVGGDARARGKVLDRPQAAGPYPGAAKCSLTESGRPSRANPPLPGRPRAFSRMSPGEAAASLRSWARSRLPLKRMAFQALKQIFTFLFYAAHAADEANPNRPATGVPGQPVPPREVPRAITPLAVTADTQIATEICVIASGAGG